MASPGPSPPHAARPGGLRERQASPQLHPVPGAKGASVQAKLFLVTGLRSRTPHRALVPCLGPVPKPPLPPGRDSFKPLPRTSGGLGCFTAMCKLTEPQKCLEQVWGCSHPGFSQKSPEAQRRGHLQGQAGSGDPVWTPTQPLLPLRRRQGASVWRHGAPPAGCGAGFPLWPCQGPNGCSLGLLASGGGGCRAKWTSACWECHLSVHQDLELGT